MKRQIFLFTLLFVIVNGCLEKLDVPIITNKPVMVVDGMISDQPGPYTVKLVLVSPLDEDLDHPDPVAGATVTISDDLGNSEVLHERIPGIYETREDGIRGVIGRKYQLKITTTDGNEFASELAQLTSAGTIDDMFFSFRENVINPNDVSRPQDAFAVLIDSRGTDGSPNLLRWRWTGIHHVKTFPELRTRTIEIDGESKEVPDPLPCSGYVTNEKYELVYKKECECCDCYVYQYSNDAILSPNSFASGDVFNNVQVSLVPVDKWLFMDKYYVEVEQLSVQESVYDFWKLVNTQQEGSGDIFQPNAVKVRGNIRCINNPDEEVFGIFSVSAITKKSIFIHRNNIPKRIPQIDTLRGDCRHAFFNSTNVKPPFW